MNKNVNRIYQKTIDGERVYCIEHTPTGLCAIFDYDESAKERVLEESKKRKKQLTPRIEKGGQARRLIFGKSLHGYRSATLAAVLYSHYHNIDLADLAGYSTQIRSYCNSDLPDGVEDCRSMSLYSPKDIVMETDSRKITLLDNGKYIRLDLKPYGVTEYLSNVPGLLELLGKPENTNFFVNAGGRTQVRINRPVHSSGNTPYLSMVAYACYYMGITEKNFAQMMPEIAQRFKERQYNIDHLNSDVHNNCAWNLSPMSNLINSSKYDLASRVKPPYFLFAAATESGEYRIRFGYRNYAGMGQGFDILCPDENVLRHFLRSVMDIENAPGLLRRYQVPKLIWGLNKKAPYAASNFERAAREAERLLSLDESRFTVWDTTGTITTGKGG